MATNSNDELLKSIDALVDETLRDWTAIQVANAEAELKKGGQLAATEATIGEEGPEGTALASQDSKGGLQGAQASKSAEAPKADMEKAVPPGFAPEKEAKESEGAEDEADEKAAEEGSEGDEASAKDDQTPEEAGDAKDSDGDGVEQKADAKDGEAGPPQDGKDEDGEGEEYSRFEKFMFKFMEKVGMGGESVQKSEEPSDEEDLVKSIDARLSKSIAAFEERIAKTEAVLAETKAALAKANDTIEKLAKAPVGARKSVSGISPILRKSEDGASEGVKSLSKAEVIGKVLDLQKSGKVSDRFLVGKLEICQDMKQIMEMVAPYGIR